MLGAEAPQLTANVSGHQALSCRNEELLLPREEKERTIVRIARALLMLGGAALLIWLALQALAWTHKSA